MKTATANFDCADIYQEHGYLVRLTKGREAKVQVFEVFGGPPAEREAQWAPETILRCEVSRDVWDIISPELRAEFNRRLKTDGKPAGRWGADETVVQRLLGKELLVLLWAVELPEITPEETVTAIRNWLGLKPEERWWLYTMTAAATGLAHHAGMGWRGALRAALCFGTRNDAFNLGAVVGRGTLPPRPNPEAPAAVAVATPRKRKVTADAEAPQVQEATAPKKRAAKPKAPKVDAADPQLKSPKAKATALKAKKVPPALAENEPKPKPKRQRAAKKAEASLFDLPVAAE